MFRTTTVAICLALAVPLGAPPVLAEALNVQRGVTTTLELARDSAVVVESDLPFAELTIANPDIADISTLSDRAIYVLGKEPGRTTLMLLGGEGQVMTIVNIQVTPDIAEFRERLDQILPGEAIEARTANDGIVLSGTVSSAQKMAQAVELAGRYAPERVSNLMTVDVAKPPPIDLARFQAELAGLTPEAGIESRLSSGRLVVSGEVPSAAMIDQVVTLAESYAPGRVQNLLVSTETIDIDAMIAQIRQIVPDEPVEAALVGGSIVLSGRMSSSEALGQVMRIAELFAPGWSITNLMTLREECTVRTRRGGEVVELPVPCTD